MNSFILSLRGKWHFKWITKRNSNIYGNRSEYRTKLPKKANQFFSLNLERDSFSVLFKNIKGINATKSYILENKLVLSFIQNMNTVCLQSARLFSSELLFKL